MVKYTAQVFCKELYENDSIFYTDFKFCKVKNLKYFKNILGCKNGKVNQKMLWYTKTIMFFGQLPTSNSKVLFELRFFFHDDLCYYVKYSIVEYQVQIFKTYHQG
jgi:hypothetical protein